MDVLRATLSDPSNWADFDKKAVMKQSLSPDSVFPLIWEIDAMPEPRQEFQSGLFYGFNLEDRCSIEPLEDSIVRHQSRLTQSGLGT